ncbi:hypothetical protein [Leucothrix mucor]|uniref:hypothetical protein n=1 Tax=Leucothrix mucor TaxID=45248 RepID=UPI0003B316C6|nr:hypothetical protein [Leucothrix mucor]
MPFHGVRPERRYLFHPSPVSDVGVNDANVWRLNPAHRHVYNKLHVALSQGLIAAPSGVSPIAMGLEPEHACFVKPITNLGGMSLNSFATTAQALTDATINGTENTASNSAAGSFWCEFLSGTQTSTDVLVLNGEPQWYGHTKAADQRDKNRPIYWLIGADCQDSEAHIETFIRRELADYTGLCNVEMIGSHIIEVHLRGSNAFFDYYPDAFMQAWVNLVDHQTWQGLEPINQGCLYSLFGDWTLPDNAEQLVEASGARLYRDGMMADRVGIIFADCPETAQSIEAQLKQSSC